ncbi:MAG: uracil-DNA glycosylase family protein [Bryobacteraceae bacterium]
MDPELLRRYLSYFQDLGIRELYRRAAPPVEPEPAVVAEPPAASAPGLFAEGVGGVQGALLVAPEAEKPSETLEQIRADLGDCKRCRLHQGRTQIVFGDGNPQARLVFVGEGPGAEEDAQGIPFVGRAGQLLTQMIENTARREGIPLLRRDVYICNVVKCRPPGNRTPEADEIEACSPFLFRQLAAISPKAICALGATAARALLGTREGVTKLRGRWYRWRHIPVMVTYHPSYLLRPYNQNAKREAWEDFKKVLHYVYD